MMPKKIKDKWYKWEGIDSKGKKISGKKLHQNKQHVHDTLTSENITPLRITQTLALNQKTTATKKEIFSFIQQLASLLKAGIGLDHALNLLADKTASAPLQKLIEQLKKQIESGVNLSDALKQHPHYFPTIHSALVCAGEESSTLPTMLTRLSEYQQKNINLTNQCKKALYYPLFVLIAATMISLCLLLFVIPQFQSIFDNFHTKLPYLTELILHCSSGLQHHGLTLFVTAGLLFLFARKLLSKHPGYKRKLHYLMLKLPFLKKIITLSMVTLWSQVTGTMLKAGIPLITALKIAVDTVNNQAINKKLTDIISNVESGQSLNDSLQQTGLFPSDVIQMVLVGESTGTLSVMLENISLHYEQELNQQINTSINLLEPIAMIFISLITGLLIAGLYLPIIRMGSVF